MSAALNQPLIPRPSTDVAVVEGQIARVPHGLPRLEKWLGGRWMLNNDGECVPETGFVPNQRVERQFMAHDENGDHVWDTYGHREMKDAEWNYPPHEFAREDPRNSDPRCDSLQKLISTKTKEWNAEYRDAPKLDRDKIIKERVDKVEAAWQARKARCEAHAAELAAKAEEEILAKADAIRARRGEPKGRGPKGA